MSHAPILQIDLLNPPQKCSKSIRDWKVGDLFFYEVRDEKWKLYWILFLVTEEEENRFRVVPVGSTTGTIPAYFMTDIFHIKSFEVQHLYFLT